MSRICPQCTQVNQDGVAFCTRCGYRFQGNEQVLKDEPLARPSGSLVNQPIDVDPSATFVPGFQARASQPEAETPQVAFPQSSPLNTPPGYTVPATPSNTPGYSVPATPSNTPAGYTLPATPSNTPAGYTLPATPSNSQGLAPQDPTPVQGGYVPVQQQGIYSPQQQQGGYPQQFYGQQQQPAPYGAPPVNTPRPGSGTSSLQRAFAGKGSPVHHQSWLLDGKQTQPATLRNSLVENVRKQGVMGVNAMPEHLREQGVIMEERDYVRVQYGSSSVFVYVAPIGEDLYVSRISTVQQPLSRIRIGVLIGLFVLMVICFLFYSVINPDLTNPNAYFAALGAKTFFSYPAYGLLFFFIFVLLRSLVFLLTDNDFLAYLRPNRLNDFTLDALSLVEQVTDKAVRETVKQEGMDPDEITRPAQSYSLEQPLHRF